MLGQLRNSHDATKTLRLPLEDVHYLARVKLKPDRNLRYVGLLGPGVRQAPRIEVPPLEEISTVKDSTFWFAHEVVLVGAEVHLLGSKDYTADTFEVLNDFPRQRLAAASQSCSKSQST